MGTRAVPLVDTALRAGAETLVHRALEVQEASPTLAVEQRSRMDRAAKDGVPHSVLPLPEDADDRRARTGSLGRSASRVRQLISAAIPLA